MMTGQLSALWSHRDIQTIALLRFSKILKRILETRIDLLSLRLQYKTTVKWLLPNVNLLTIHIYPPLHSGRI